MLKNYILYKLCCQVFFLDRTNNCFAIGVLNKKSRPKAAVTFNLEYEEFVVCFLLLDDFFKSCGFTRSLSEEVELMSSDLTMS